MSKRFISVAAILLSMAFAVTSYAAVPAPDEAEKLAPAPIGTDTAEIVVDDSTVLQEIDKMLLGTAAINTAGHFDEMVVKGTFDLNAVGKEVMSGLYKVPCMRIGIGGSCMSSIQPPAKRWGVNFATPSDGIPSEDVHSALNVGVVETIKLAQAANPDVKLILILNPMDDLDDIVNFAHFFLDEADESEWGALRAKYGFKEPLDAVFEIGNERDIAPGWRYSQGQTDWYMKRAREIVDAIKASCPEMKLIACGKTAPWSDREGTKKWTRALAETLGTDIDYISIHPYYSGNEMPIVEDYFKLEMDILDEVLGENHGVKLWVTEHADWPDKGAAAAEELMTLESVLSTSNFLNRTFANTMIYGANYHTLYHGASNRNMWTMLIYDSGKYVYQGIAKMYDLYERNIGDRVFSISMTGSSDRQDLTSTTRGLSVLASAKGDKEMKLFLTNRSQEYDVDISFKFGNKYKLVKEEVLTAPNLKSWAYNKKAEDIFTVTETAMNESSFTSYKMPAKSIVVLTLEADKKLPYLGAAADEELDINLEEVVTDFTDLDGVWAKGEIAKMKELGFVNGASATEFKPFDLITRAEFAAILARAMDYPLDYPSVFTDVNEGKWYAPYANSMYFEGIMTGYGNGSFNPESVISLEEVISAAARVLRLNNADISGDINNIQKNFTDKSKISDWAKADVYFAAQAGVLTKLYENGSIAATEPATRAQAVSIIYRLYNTFN